MAVLERISRVDQAGLEGLRRPRRDLLIERSDGDDAWTIETGPFRRYRRTLLVSSEPDPDGHYQVVERTDYKMALPLWWPYLWILFRRALADTEREPRRRWWWPKEVVAAETSNLIALLGTIGMMAGYMGVVIGQTITFAARDFGVEDDAQANTLAAIRIGVLLSLVFLGLADRRGRRVVILWFALIACLFTALGAVADGMFSLGASQMVSRGLVTGLITLITLATTEEVPASSRAMAVGFATLTTGFGAALVVWVTPVADISTGSWRIAYLVPLLFLPLLWWVARRLPETRRYVAAEVHDAPAPINWRRFALVASTAFITLAYLSPASQLRNEFLTDDQGYTATQVSLFQLLVSLPATASIPIGGFMADRFGRRWWGAGALAVGSIFSAISFQSSGWVLWVTSGIGVSASASAIPALRGYQTELFPTRARGRVGGMIDTVGVAGSALGLVVVGQLTAQMALGRAIGTMALAPMIVAIIIVVGFPETAQRELEDFNPGDPRLDPIRGDVDPRPATEPPRR